MRVSAGPSIIWPTRGGLTRQLKKINRLPNWRPLQPAQFAGRPYWPAASGRPAGDVILANKVLAQSAVVSLDIELRRRRRCCCCCRCRLERSELGPFQLVTIRQDLAALGATRSCRRGSHPFGPKGCEPRRPVSGQRKLARSRGARASALIGRKENTSNPPMAQRRPLPPPGRAELLEDSTGARDKMEANNHCQRSPRWPSSRRPTHCCSSPSSAQHNKREPSQRSWREFCIGRQGHFLALSGRVRWKF